MGVHPNRMERAARAALPHLPLIAVTAALAVVTTREVLSKCGGPGVPLDDSYIHFQYARSLAELHPFRYTAGAAPTPGTTSLLWPLLLAPLYALGLHGQGLIWGAWALGWTSLGLLALETRRLAAGLVRPPIAAAAGAMTLAFGGFAWFAASGMEVVPFAWLLTRTARCAADWVERASTAAEPGEDGASGDHRRYRELVVLAVLCPLMRPEGALGSALVALTLVIRPYRGRRALAAIALSGPLLPSAVCFLATGQAALSTAVAKWLPLNPYYRGPLLWTTISTNIGTFFSTLIDGRLWTSVFLPPGGRWLAALALASIPLAGVRKDRLPRALLVLALGLAILVPTTYETFLVNRVRYIWPFAPAWFVGAATLSEIAGEELERVLSGLGVLATHSAVLAAGAFVGLLGSRIGPSIDDLAESASAVSQQQGSMAKWARDSLPAGARIGVNDTGAMAYLSDHPTFDVVGLTTSGEARYWTAGAGSRFEHYEHLTKDELPTHFIVYPEWFGMDVLLGEELANRRVHHTILGGANMVAYRASYEVLGTGERPLDVAVGGRRPLDSLDVADVADEARHGYHLLDGTQARNVVVSGVDRADGARTVRTRDQMTLGLSPGGLLVARWGSKVPVRVRVLADGRRLGEADLAGEAWQEIALPVPTDLAAGLHAVEVAASEGTFDSMHYWSYE